MSFPESIGGALLSIPTSSVGQTFNNSISLGNTSIDPELAPGLTGLASSYTDMQCQIVKPDGTSEWRSFLPLQQTGNPSAPIPIRNALITLCRLTPKPSQKVNVEPQDNFTNARTTNKDKSEILMFMRLPFTVPGSGQESHQLGLDVYKGIFEVQSLPAQACENGMSVYRMGQPANCDEMPEWRDIETAAKIFGYSDGQISSMKKIFLYPTRNNVVPWKHPAHPDAVLIASDTFQAIPTASSMEKAYLMMFTLMHADLHHQQAVPKLSTPFIRGIVRMDAKTAEKAFEIVKRLHQVFSRQKHLENAIPLLELFWQAKSLLEQQNLRLSAKQLRQE